MRLAVNDNYDKVIYIEVAKDLMEDGRILEDDYITIMGTSFGLLDYESAIGSQITFPVLSLTILMKKPEKKLLRLWKTTEPVFFYKDRRA